MSQLLLDNRKTQTELIPLDFSNIPEPHQEEKDMMENFPQAREPLVQLVALMARLIGRNSPSRVIEFLINEQKTTILEKMLVLDSLKKH